MAIVETKGLTKVYGTGETAVTALDAVDLSLDPGEFVAVMGPSGCGKSTLLNLVGGLDTPTSGTVTIDGREISQLSDDEITRLRRERIGFVFQFFNLIPVLTARENVDIAAELVESPLPSDEVLDRVGMAERMDHFPSQMSGGEQQRVAIARALVKNPLLLLCDEPTGSLDASTGRLILAQLDEINRKFGTTVVVVTHNAAIADMARRVVRMSSGRIVEEIYNDEPLPPERISW